MKIISDNPQSRIYDFSESSSNDFKQEFSQYEDYKISDVLTAQTKELAFVKQPSLLFSDKDDREARVDQFSKELYRERLNFQKGSWIVLKKSKQIFHILDKENFTELRTNRNRNIITWTEQKKLYSKKIAIVGLSVGANVAACLTRLGVGSQYFLADFDAVETHNLNRTPYFLADVGGKKVELIASQLLCIDPYLEIETVNEPITTQQVQTIVSTYDLVIDAFDNIETKILLREEAKKCKTPIVSGWDVSSGIVLIVERYDKEDGLDTSFFLHGQDKKTVLDNLNQSFKQKIDTIIEVVGKENHTGRLLESVRGIGETVSGIPQISIGTYLAAAVFTQALTDIFLEKQQSSIRKLINLEELLSN